MKAKRAASVLVAVVLFALSACTTTRYLAPTESSELLRQRVVHVVMIGNTELSLRNCLVQSDKLVGFQEGLMKEVELSRIYAVYAKKLKPGAPIIAALCAAAAAVTIWLISGAATSPSAPP